MKRALIMAGAGAALLMAAPAAADGGRSIAAATPVVYGQQQFGNTANGEPDGSCDLNSWWMLAVTAGDKLTIDIQHENAFTWVRVFPVGTTDFTFRETEPVVERLWPPEQFQLRVTAPQTGGMPLLFNANPSCVQAVDPGPYDFTAYVRHAVRLQVPQRAELRRRTTLKVNVRNPEGAAIDDPALTVTVQVKASAARWRSVGSGPAVNGVAGVHLNIPRRFVGHKVAVRARATGADYLSAASATRRMRIR